MLLSVPDTPFGHALGQFMLLFDRYPLDLGHAQAAFATLSALAAREHPDRPWPLLVPAGENEPAVSITVDGMLALKRARYADLLPAPDADVAGGLAAWTGATVHAASAERANTADSVLHMELKLPTGQTQWLTAHCPWQVTPAGEVARRWNDAVAPLRRAVTALRRAKVAHVQVQPSGALEVTLATGSCLLVGAAGWGSHEAVADLHYWLQTDDGTFLRVGTQFLLQPRPKEEENSEDAANA